jgi:folate-binding protein YgfZ
MSPAIEPVLVPLGSAEIIEIAGPDAVAFAHAQFTSDVAGVAVGAWQWSAWLSAQGRTRCVFVLLRTENDRLLLWLPLGGAAPLRDALARYVLRAKVRIERRDGWALARMEGALPELAPRQAIAGHDGHVFAQPGTPERIAWLGPAPAAHADTAAIDAWRLDDIAARLPWLDPTLQDVFVPQALDLPRIDAIRFDKGCYPGQEIAARLHFKGGLKRGLHRLRLSGAQTVHPGLRIRNENGNGESGVVLYGAANPSGSHDALAVLPDSQVGALRLRSDDGHEATIVA